MKAKLLSFLKYLFFLSMGTLILYLVFKGKDLEKMLEDLRNAEYKYLIFSMIFANFPSKFHSTKLFSTKVRLV